MKMDKWTVALAAVGLVSVPAAGLAEEKLSAVETALASTTISGYVNVAAQWNPGTGNANPPAFVFNDRSKQDAFSLNAIRLALEKPLDEAKWAAGYKVDLMFGPDADTLSTQSTGEKGDFAVRQAYVSLGVPVGNGLNFTMGVFDPIHGYEVHDAGANPNYTRSYGYTIEPVSHTGILGAYSFCECFSVKAGIANTFGPKINENANMYGKAESFKSYMGAITLTAPKEWGILAGSILNGAVMNGFNSGVGDNQTSWYVGATVPTPLKGLKVGASYDYVDIHDGGYAWNMAGYSSFQVAEKLSLHGRVEYLSRSDTFGSYGPTYLYAPDGSGVLQPVAAGFPTQIVEATATIQYDLWKNVLSRLEFRWDHAADGSYAYGDNTADSLTGETRPSLKNSYSLMANIIYNF